MRRKRIMRRKRKKQSMRTRRTKRTRKLLKPQLQIPYQEVLLLHFLPRKIDGGVNHLP
jgi:hypothetical protein